MFNLLQSLSSNLSLMEEFMKKRLLGTLAAILSATMLASCTAQPPEPSKTTELDAKDTPVSFQLVPETMELTLSKDGKSYPLFLGDTAKKTEQLNKSDTEISFEYPDDNMKVSAKQQADYVSLNITALSKDQASFQFPQIYADAYILPIGEGKYIPTNDSNWKSYLTEHEIDTIESSSMSFLALEKDDAGIVIILENNFNNTLGFDTKDTISMSLSHEFPSINPDREMNLRIYLTDKNPASIAKVYRNYVIEKGEFKTLEEKAALNPNVEKLFGASHIYLWDETVISEPDIKWSAFREQLDSPTFQYVSNFIQEQNFDGFAEAIEEIRGQDYVGDFQKNVICRALSNAMLSPNFFSMTAFPKQDSTAQVLIAKGIDNLTETETIQLNKHLLYSNMEGVFAPPENWADDRTIDLIKNLQSAGVDTARLGLHSWTQGFIKPEMVAYAEQQGYLIGPYDSYHSIHQPGKEEWITASFPDSDLYENATIIKRNGTPSQGFQGVGRKLNPTLSLPAVQKRMKTLMDNKVSFNTWFIDCDATGEIYDDYSPNHTTTKSEDLKARLERMAYIRDEYGMVIGSESGNDFAADTINPK